MSFSNPFSDPALVSGYEDWYAGEGKRADLAERRAIQHMLEAFPGGRRALEIGCGTAHFSRWLTSLGWRVTAVDLSKAMLVEAARRNGGPLFACADAQALPFPGATFDVSLMITSLEFVPDAVHALREAARVTRCGIVLGVLNRWGPLARQRKRSGIALWQIAHFYSPFELRALVTHTLGLRRASDVAWLTTLLPSPCDQCLTRLPIGAFITMRVGLS